MLGWLSRLRRLDPSKPTLLIVSQVYVPDPASVGQHLHDVATEMVRRGFQVVVFTANRGYEHPGTRYAPYERLDAVHVARFPCSSFGKSSLAVRLLGGGSFLSQAISVALTLPRLDRVLVPTSPPMGIVAGAALHRLRRTPFTFWAMDLNPDQIVASGGMSAAALPVRAFDALNEQTLRAAERVVALDRAMLERLCDKHAIRDRVTVIPPWPHADVSAPLDRLAGRRFRAVHRLQDKRVIMYSGNLSPVHPVATLLEAARRLRDDSRLSFVFVGAGLGRAGIERFVADHALQNVRTLPYQPLSELAESLSAADVHLVSMGAPMVGVVHPCKIYGAMAVGRPILALGPRASHVAEIVIGHDVGWHVEHGDVDGMLAILQTIGNLQSEALGVLGARARQVVAEKFSRAELRRQFCDVLEFGNAVDNMDAA